MIRVRVSVWVKLSVRICVRVSGSVRVSVKGRVSVSVSVSARVNTQAIQMMVSDNIPGDSSDEEDIG